MSPAVFVIVCALVLSAAMLFRRSGDSGNDDSDPAQEPRTPGMRSYEWDGAYRDAFQRALDTLGALGAVVVEADPHRGAITARIGPSPVSFAPLGASYRIDLSTRGETTFVEVRAAPLIPLLRSLCAAALLARFEEIWFRLPLPAPSRSR
jgi:hypothetical protein